MVARKRWPVDVKALQGRHNIPALECRNEFRGLVELVGFTICHESLAGDVLGVIREQEGDHRCDVGFRIAEAAQRNFGQRLLLQSGKASLQALTPSGQRHGGEHVDADVVGGPYVGGHAG